MASKSSPSKKVRVKLFQQPTNTKELGNIFSIWVIQMESWYPAPMPRDSKETLRFSLRWYFLRPFEYETLVRLLENQATDLSELDGGPY